MDLADCAAVPRAAGQVDTGSTYTWNAENRLVSVARTYPALAADPNDLPVKVEFRYDYLGRRIEKRVLPWNPALNSGAGGWDAGRPTKVTRYLWSGWLMLLELDGLADCGTPGSPAECIVRKYTWGLDLAGLNGAPSRDRQGAGLEDAGGIGGLLAAYDPNANLPLWYFYDANGNVGQVLTMISVDGENYGIVAAAKYEYDPYGNRTNEPAQGEYEQPFQYSTKQWDPETGLLYFGLRYRDRERWISRDPIGEWGGIALYMYGLNRPTMVIDAFGLDCTCTPGGKCYSLKAGVSPARNLDPSKVKSATMIAIVAVEFGNVWAPTGVPRCDKYSPSPTSIELTGAFGTLIAAMADANAGSIWTRYQCEKCEQHCKALDRPWWVWVVGPDIAWNWPQKCENKWVPQGPESEWKRCTEKLDGLIPIGTPGLSDEAIKKLVKQCLEAAVDGAAAACGADRPCD